MAAINLATTVSTNGQVILPKAIRNRPHCASGTRLTVEQTAACPRGERSTTACG